MQPNRTKKPIDKIASSFRFVTSLALAGFVVSLSGHFLGIWDPVRLSTTIALQVIFALTYAFIDAAFFLFRRKLLGNEGFFFVGVLIGKIIFSWVGLAIYDKLANSLNHSFILLFVVSYFIYLGLYSFRIIKILNKA